MALSADRFRLYHQAIAVHSFKTGAEDRVDLPWRRWSVSGEFCLPHFYNPLGPSSIPGSLQKAATGGAFTTFEGLFRQRRMYTFDARNNASTSVRSTVLGAFIVLRRRPLPAVDASQRSWSSRRALQDTFLTTTTGPASGYGLTCSCNQTYALHVPRLFGPSPAVGELFAKK